MCKCQPREAEVYKEEKYLGSWNCNFGDTFLDKSVLGTRKSQGLTKIKAASMLNLSVNNYDPP